MPQPTPDEMQKEVEEFAENIVELIRAISSRPAPGADIDSTDDRCLRARAALIATLLKKV